MSRRHGFSRRSPREAFARKRALRNRAGGRYGHNLAFVAQEDSPMPTADAPSGFAQRAGSPSRTPHPVVRSEEHTSELQSLMRNSYAVFCLKTKKNNNNQSYSSK